MFENTWNFIIEWFQDYGERSKLVRDFNSASKKAFLGGLVPTLLKASVSRGDKSYKHQFSHWLNSGFRIQAFQGRQLSRDELVQIGKVILADDVLIRKLVVLGFDTLEICGDVGSYGCKWQLRDHLQLTC
jgi:nicotinamidase-related amidase